MNRIIQVISNNTAVAGGAAVLIEYKAFETQYKITLGMQLAK
jgi:hypothetical protein